jgi:hypothetical protein
MGGHVVNSRYFALSAARWISLRVLAITYHVGQSRVTPHVLWLCQSRNRTSPLLDSTHPSQLLGGPRMSHSHQYHFQHAWARTQGGASPRACSSACVSPPSFLNGSVGLWPTVRAQVSSLGSVSMGMVQCWWEWLVNTGSLSSIPPTTDCQHACVHKRDVVFECAVLVGVVGAHRRSPPPTNRQAARLVGGSGGCPPRHTHPNLRPAAICVEISNMIVLLDLRSCTFGYHVEGINQSVPLCPCCGGLDKFPSDVRTAVLTHHHNAQHFRVAIFCSRDSACTCVHCLRSRDLMRVGSAFRAVAG